MNIVHGQTRNAIKKAMKNKIAVASTLKPSSSHADASRSSLSDIRERQCVHRRDANPQEEEHNQWQEEHKTKANGSSGRSSLTDNFHAILRQARLSFPKKDAEQTEAAQIEFPKIFHQYLAHFPSFHPRLLASLPCCANRTTANE